jgi:hypothetical protein
VGSWQHGSRGWPWRRGWRGERIPCIVHAVCPWLLEGYRDAGCPYALVGRGDVGRGTPEVWPAGEERRPLFST